MALCTLVQSLTYTNIDGDIHLTHVFVLSEMTAVVSSGFIVSLNVRLCAVVFCKVWSGSGDALGAVSGPHGTALQRVSGSSAACSHAAVQE